MSDGPVNRDSGVVRDNDGNVYDIEGDRAESAPVDPRNATAGYPTGAFIAGGAGGTGGMGAASAGGLGSAAPGSDSDLRATSESGVRGTVAESADLGQRPLSDYKREGDAAADATRSTVSGSPAGDGDPADARPAGNYVSDADAARTGTGPAASADAGDRGSGGRSIDTDDTSPLGGVPADTLSSVREGFRVVDVAGDDIGKVRDLRSGDAGAATRGGADDGYDEGVDQTTDSVGVAAVPTGVGTGTGGTGTGAGIPAVVANDAEADVDGVFGDDEPDVDEPAFSRLSRTGFIRIDSKGWFSKDRYAGADQVDRVDGETVYLSVAKDDLIPAR